MGGESETREATVETIEVARDGRARKARVWHRVTESARGPKGETLHRVERMISTTTASGAKVTWPETIEDGLTLPQAFARLAEIQERRLLAQLQYQAEHMANRVDDDPESRQRAIAEVQARVDALAAAREDRAPAPDTATKIISRDVVRSERAERESRPAANALGVSAAAMAQLARDQEAIEALEVD